MLGEGKKRFLDRFQNLHHSFFFYSRGIFDVLPSSLVACTVLVEGKMIGISGESCQRIERVSIDG